MIPKLIEEGQKFEVLIVDDISENLQVLGNILSERNLDVSFASNGQQALDAVEFEAPDVILLDISMPEMDGFEVCKRLQANPTTKDIPVIFLTAKTESESVVKGFKLGAVDYVTKPFNAAELVSRVFTHIELNLSRKLIKQQNQKLQKQNNDLQELNATKDKFFSIVAHDLKNPFNTIIGFAELLITKKDMKPEKLSRFHQYIYDSSQKAYSLLENLLDWSRSQTGRLQWKPDNINIAAIACEVIDLLAGTASNKAIELTLKVEDPLYVFADGNMITTVIRNLVSNALKFTKEGGFVKIISASKNNMIEITIEDSGIGISEENIKKLFRIDENVSTTGTAKEKGTGLGLILCKEFVEKNNGNISVESKIGQGSKFIFTLPKKQN